MKEHYKIRMYLRQKLQRYWRPLVLKEKCQQCNSINNLELHHKSDTFKDIVLDVLHEFGYDEDTEINDINNIELITDVVLGRHLKIKHMTLCSDCHIKEHQRLSNKHNRRLFEDIEFPKEFLDIPLTAKEKDLIVEYYDLYNENGRQYKWRGIKTFLIDSNIYQVTSKSIRISGSAHPIKCDIVRKINKDLKGDN